MWMYCAFLNIDRNLVLLFSTSELGQELNFVLEFLYFSFCKGVWKLVLNQTLANTGIMWPDASRCSIWTSNYHRYHEANNTSHAVKHITGALQTFCEATVSQGTNRSDFCFAHSILERHLFWDTVVLKMPFQLWYSWQNIGNTFEKFKMLELLTPLVLIDLTVLWQLVRTTC